MTIIDKIKDQLSGAADYDQRTLLREAKAELEAALSQGERVEDIFDVVLIPGSHCPECKQPLHIDPTPPGMVLPPKRDEAEAENRDQLHFVRGYNQALTEVDEAIMLAAAPAAQVAEDSDDLPAPIPSEKDIAYADGYAAGVKQGESLISAPAVVVDEAMVERADAYWHSKVIAGSAGEKGWRITFRDEFNLRDLITAALGQGVGS